MNWIDRLSSLANRPPDEPGRAELEALLDYWPQATLLVDRTQNRILMANAKATELTAYTRAELCQLPLPELIPTLGGPEGQGVQWRSRTTVEGTLRNRLGGEVAVELTPMSLDSDRRWAALAVEPARTSRRRQSELDLRTNLWEALHELLLATQLEDLPAAFHQALSAGQALSGAEMLATYQLLAHKPGLLRYAMLGDRNALPENIQSVDLSRMLRVDLWTPGRPATTSLQKAAHKAKFSYLVTAPLGDPSALQGMLVLGDRSSAPHEHLVPITHLVADAVSTLLQFNILTTNLQDRIHHQKIDLSQSEAVHSSVDEGIIVLSPNLRILSLNAAAELTLSYATQEVQGQPVQNILIGTNTLTPALRAAQKGQPTHNLGNLTLHRRDGQTFQAHVLVLPVKSSGKLERVLIVFRDLSEREQFRARTQQLEQRALLGEVTAIFAHEVRNPINNLSTGLQLMAMNLPKEDPGQEVIQRLQEDCNRLEHLMGSVLDFSRTNEYTLEPVDLQDLVKRLLERWRPRMVRVGVEDRLHVQPETPRVLGDRRALEQVFTNLISNSITAMKDQGGALAVKIYPARGAPDRPRVHISVSDTGPGIPEEVLENIFKPFFTTNPDGTGLGLAITKQIITAHRGTIHVNSFPGATMFQLQLPAVVAGQASSEEAPEELVDAK